MVGKIHFRQNRFKWPMTFLRHSDWMIFTIKTDIRQVLRCLKVSSPHKFTYFGFPRCRRQKTPVTRCLYRRRIIKDIRCNFMLGWLKRVANNAPIVLMIRHPLQIVSSWSRLGWGKEALGHRSDFDIITSQESLMNDFPIIRDVMKRVDLQDYVER